MDIAQRTSATASTQTPPTRVKNASVQTTEELFPVAQPSQPTQTPAPPSGAQSNPAPGFARGTPKPVVPQLPYGMKPKKKYEVKEQTKRINWEKVIVSTS